MPRPKFKPLNEQSLDELYDFRAYKFRQLVRVQKESRKVRRRVLEDKDVSGLKMNVVSKTFYIELRTLKDQIALIEAQIKSKQDQELLRAYERLPPEEVKKAGKPRRGKA